VYCKGFTHSLHECTVKDLHASQLDVHTTWCSLIQ